MEACSGQNHDNKTAPQVNFTPTAASIMDLLCIFVITRQYFFSMLVIIFSNMSYFCFYYTNTFLIHTTNYFSVVLQIIFLMTVYQELVFHQAKNYFSELSQIYFLAYNALRALQLKWNGLHLLFDFLGRPFQKLCKQRSAFKENAKVKHCQGTKRKRFSSFLQNLSGACSLWVSDEVFWTKDLIEETKKGLQDLQTILTLIENVTSVQLNSSLPNLV